MAVAIDVQAQRATDEQLIRPILRLLRLGPVGLARRHLNPEQFAVGVRVLSVAHDQTKLVGAHSRIRQRHIREAIGVHRPGALVNRGPVTFSIRARIEQPGVTVDEQAHFERIRIRGQRPVGPWGDDFSQRVGRLVGKQRVIGIDPPGADVPQIGIEVSVVDGIGGVLQNGADLDVRQLGPMRQEQGRDRPDVGAGEGGSGGGNVLVVQVGRDDIRTRRGNIHPEAEGAVAGLHVLTVGGGDGHHVVVGSGVERAARVVIACTGHQEDAVRIGVVDGGLDDRVALRPEVAAPEAHVDDVRPVGRGVIEGGRHFLGRDFDAQAQGHDAGLPVDAGDALAVVAHGGDDPGDLRSMTDDRRVETVGARRDFVV